MLLAADWQLVDYCQWDGPLLQWVFLMISFHIRMYTDLGEQMVLSTTGLAAEPNAMTPEPLITGVGKHPVSLDKLILEGGSPGPSLP